jgi:hypothetical protein
MIWEGSGGAPIRDGNSPQEVPDLQCGFFGIPSQTITAEAPDEELGEFEDFDEEDFDDEFDDDFEEEQDEEYDAENEEYPDNDFGTGVDLDEELEEDIEIDPEIDGDFDEGAASEPTDGDEEEGEADVVEGEE